jgi:hypothetical protein
MKAARGILSTAALLLLASASHAQQAPVPPPPLAPHAAVPAIGCGACSSCCETRSCVQRLCEWLTYRPLCQPSLCDCCKRCAPCCHAPLYAYFLMNCAGNGHGCAGCGTGACHECVDSCAKPHELHFTKPRGLRYSAATGCGTTCCTTNVCVPTCTPSCAPAATPVVCAGRPEAVPCGTSDQAGVRNLLH